MADATIAPVIYWQKDGPLHFRLVKNGRVCAAVDLDRRMVTMRGERPRYIPRSVCPFDAAEKNAGVRRVNVLRDAAGDRLRQDDRRDVEREVRRYRPMPKHNLLTARALLEHAETTGDLSSDGQAAARHIRKALRAVKVESWEVARNETNLAVTRLQRVWSDVPCNIQMMAMRFCEDASADLSGGRFCALEPRRSSKPTIV